MKQNGESTRINYQRPSRIKNKHTETNNTIFQIKNTPEGSIAEYMKEQNESVSWEKNGGNNF